jgi:hypothetical protein
LCNAHLALARLLLIEGSRRQTVRHHLLVPERFSKCFCVPGRFPKCLSCFRAMSGVWLLVATILVGGGVLVAIILGTL